MYRHLCTITHHHMPVKLEWGITEHEGRVFFNGIRGFLEVVHCTGRGVSMGSAHTERSYQPGTVSPETLRGAGVWCPLPNPQLQGF